MGFGLFGSILILILSFRPLLCQEPNTDGFFVSEFLNKMGSKHLQSNEFSGPYCSWRGVFCDSTGENVVKLEFSGLGLSGVIPDTTIGKLMKLQTLDLSNNKIHALPNDFWSLGSLKNLNLSLNLISGILPANIANFGLIQTLDLSSNNFTGNIPDSIASLVSLRALNLSKNGFESAIPLGILQCRSLVAIDLSINKLNATLPRGFVSAAFPKLRFLNLAGNRLSGRGLDFDLFGMKSISYLNVSGNLFSGSVGVFEGPLQVIDLSRNRFEGLISQVNFNTSFNWSNLVFLDISDNLFSGTFGVDLSHALNLKHLNVANNRFGKQKFLKVCMLSGLKYLNLSAASLTGPIPRNISLLSSLLVLDLSKNKLSSHVPPIFSDKLRVLDLSYNELTGDIPLVILDELHAMKMFNFSYNKLSFCVLRLSNESRNALEKSSFVGLVNNCPIAANPAFFKRNAPKKHRGLKVALALAISLTCFLVGLLCLAFGCRRRETRMRGAKEGCSFEEERTISGPFSFQTDSTTWTADVKQATSVPVIIFEKPLLNFTFADLLSATSHFDRGTLLAEGRFGPVYGGLLPGGIHVAVKVLVNQSLVTYEEAVQELEYLGRIKHPNLVPLTGYCLAGDQRIALYEYMENGNLQNLLHDLPLGIQTTEDWSNDEWEVGSDRIQTVGCEGSLSSWGFRYKIVLGTARALAFLHHGCSPPIIHRDIKASSVYLDYNLEPRLSDYGLAKLSWNGVNDDVASGSTGYTPPEFLDSSTEAATPKSDVYGFGVILFELLTGKKPIDGDYGNEKESTLVSWVRGLVRRKEVSRAIDPKIQATESEEAKMVEALKIGYLCTAEDPAKRPSMQQVVGLLKDLEPINTQL